MRLLRRPAFRLGWSALTLMFSAAALRADEVQLKNGVTLKGTVVPVSGLDARSSAQAQSADVPAAAYWMIDDQVRRYFVSKRQTAEIVPEALLTQVSFELKPQRTGARGVPALIGSYPRAEFDKHGHRVVTLTIKRGNEQVPEHVSQSITLIRPTFVRVEATSHDWRFGLDLSAIPADTLRSVIGTAIHPQKLADRQGVVMFYLYAEQYKQARLELEAMAAEFPEQAAWVEEVETRLAHLGALRALDEIRNRQSAGQHQLAYLVASKFPPERVAADVLREAQDIVADYDAARQKFESAKMLLGQLQAELPADKAAAVAPLRAAIIEELHPENIDRLDPFLRAEQDATLSPAEKLALACSAWVLGAGNAVTNLDDALRLWHARFLVLEYLRNNDDPARRKSLAAELGKTEGINVARVAQIVDLLPPPLETPGIVPGQPAALEAKDAWNRTTQRYSVILPPEYSPQHRYPLLVVLRAEGTTAEQELVWWAGLPEMEKHGPAQRRGYIVIAPEYAAAEQGEYNYQFETHQTVLESIFDARKRFRIDSDRVFLGGHGMGADACFDLGMSHPEVFAGVMPIAGISDKYCMYAHANARGVAWYVVTGERDGDAQGLSLERNARDLTRMMLRGDDVIYCEYKARGYESYFEEASRLFDWMALHRRAPEPAEWEYKVTRHTDTRCHWLQMAGLPDKLKEPVVWEIPGRRPRPLTIKGKATVSRESVYVDHSAKEAAVWLSPRLVDFDQRVKIHSRGKQVFNDFLTPSLEDLLEDLRVRGDRERLYWVKVQL